MPGKFVIHTIPFDRVCARCGLNRYGHNFLELEQGYTGNHYVVLCDDCLCELQDVVNERVKELFDEEEE